MTDTIEQVAALLVQPPNLVLLVEEHNGTFALPGGRVEPEDPNLLSAIQRELVEEIALSLSADRLVPIPPAVTFTYNRPGSSRYGKTGCLHLFKAVLAPEDTLQATDEIKACQWMPIPDAISRASFAHIQEILRAHGATR